MTLYININTSVSDADGDISSRDLITRVGIEIDHEANWEMPQIEEGVDLPYDTQEAISDYMEKWIAEKFDPSDFMGDPDDYYERQRESA